MIAEYQNLIYNVDMNLYHLKLQYSQITNYLYPILYNDYGNYQVKVMQLSWD